MTPSPSPRLSAFDAAKRLVRLMGFMRGRVVLALLLLVAMGIFESAGVMLLVPLLGAIGLDVQDGGVGRLASLATSLLDSFGATPTLPLVLGVFLVINLVLALLRRTLTVVSTSLEQEVVRSLVARLYDGVVRMDWVAFSRMRASDFVVALTTNAERVGVAVSQTLTIASSLVVTTAYVMMALRVSVPMTIVVLTCGLAVVLGMRHRAAAATRIGRTFNEAAQEFQAAVSDDLAGLKTIRSVAGESRSLSRLVSLAGQLSEARLAIARHYANGTFLVDFGSMVLLSAIVLFAVGQLQLQPSALLLLLFLFSRVVPRLSGLLHNVQYLANVLPSMDRIHELEATCAADAEPPIGGSSPLRLQHAIVLQRVSFRYTSSERPILMDLDLEIRRGTTVAILGPSGSGKTTVADLLLGLLRPDAGRILVDGVELTRGNIGAWRQSVAYVAQDTFLFHDTIRANLHWAAPEATETDIHQALRLAAADFVAALPDGLDTIVGDRGARLSGGERQRIALARAILRHPSLLILDEATSALDPENERRILQTVRRLHGAMTILMITHRASAAAVADVVHVVEKGRLIESHVSP